MRKLTAKEIRRKNEEPNTEVFHWHNENPKGNLTADCVVRAIATATGKTWEEIFKELSETAYKNSLMANDKKNIEKYLKQIGWYKSKQPRKADGTKYTGKEFCEHLNRCKCKFNVIANIGGHHMVCIKRVDGKYKVHDTWDSTEKCIGNYWEEP